MNDAEIKLLDENMIEVFAIVKDACRRLYGMEFFCNASKNEMGNDPL